MIKKSVGRPPKYSEPARAVTVTLPERVLEKLHRIDSDRGVAIAKAVDALVTNSDLQRPQLELIHVGDGFGLIVIEYSEALSRMPGIRLVQISPLRYLISIETGMSVDTLELALLDLIDHLPVHEASEAPLLLSLRGTLKLMRHNQGLTKAEILLVPIS